MSTRVLFLNTRDSIGADVAVHLTLLDAADGRRVVPYLWSNRNAVDVAAMRRRVAGMPSDRIRFVDLGQPRVGKTGIGVGALAAASWMATLIRASAFVRRSRIDVVHATDRPRDAVSAVFVARLAGCASVVHMHSNAGPHLAAATRWGFRHATGLFAVSDAVRCAMVGMGLDPVKIHVVPNAVDARWFDPSVVAGAGRQIRAQAGIGPDEIILCQVARINAWKGQLETIGALGMLAKDGFRPRLLLVGSGNDETLDQLRRHAAKVGVEPQLVFAGVHADVRPFLDACDLFVHPSHDEPFGLAIAEAMAMAKPVLACRSGGVPEMVLDGRDGILVEPRSAIAIAEGIRLWRQLPDRGHSLGVSARIRVREGFTPARALDAAASAWNHIRGPSAPAEGLASPV